MRPLNGDYDEFDEFDDIGYGGVEANRRMINDRQRHEQRLGGRRRSGRAAGKDRWDDDEWGQYDDYGDNDYDDFSDNEFDRISELSIDHH